MHLYSQMKQLGLNQVWLRKQTLPLQNQTPPTEHSGLHFQKVPGNTLRRGLVMLSSLTFGLPIGASFRAVASHQRPGLLHTGGKEQMLAGDEFGTDG